MIPTTLLFLSGMDISMILGVALLLFGGKKLPELARGLGSGIKEFKDATSGVITPNSDNIPKTPVPVTELNPVPTTEPAQGVTVIPTTDIETHG